MSATGIAACRSALGCQAVLERTGNFRKSTWSKSSSLTRISGLDIRYATGEIIFCIGVYKQARAFLQRPAAVSVVAPITL